MEGFWTERHVKKLKELLSKGFSTSEIGKKLGVSKNTVIGKIHRLRQANDLDLVKEEKPVKNTKKSRGIFSFSFSKKTVSSSNDTVTEVKKLSKVYIKDNKLAEKKVEIVNVKKVSDENDTISNEFLKDEQSNLRDNKDKRYQLRDLKNDMCRWAYGEPNSNNFFFCGKKTLENRPYCLKHARMAYISKKNED